jgi:hypothetical protein
LHASAVRGQGGKKEGEDKVRKGGTEDCGLWKGNEATFFFFFIFLFLLCPTAPKTAPALVPLHPSLPSLLPFYKNTMADEQLDWRSPRLTVRKPSRFTPTRIQIPMQVLFNMHSYFLMTSMQRAAPPTCNGIKHNKLIPALSILSPFNSQDLSRTLAGLRSVAGSSSSSGL